MNVTLFKEKHGLNNSEGTDGQPHGLKDLVRLYITSMLD